MSNLSEPFDQERMEILVIGVELESTPRKRDDLRPLSGARCGLDDSEVCADGEFAKPLSLGGQTFFVRAILDEVPPKEFQRATEL